MIVHKNSIYLSRRMVDKLLERYPTWMASEWTHTHKLWAIAGVKVTGTTYAISTIHKMIKEVSK